MPIDVQGLTPLIQVFDMPASLRFYRDVLGFAVVSMSGTDDESDWVWLRLNYAEIMLNTAYERDTRPAAPDASRSGSHGDTCLFIGCEKVDEAYAYLQSRGIAGDPPKTAPYGMRQLYLKDPDGYGLCFQWPATAAAAD